MPRTRTTTKKDLPASRAGTKEKQLPLQKLRIRLAAYDHKVIDSSCKQIIDTVVREGCDVVGPIPLPTSIKKWTVNRSSFIHKDAREQYEMRVHKRLIDIPNPNARVIESLSSLNLPAGVDIEIKM